jgi:hypothetical protein
MDDEVTEESILKDASTSYWLRDQLKVTSARDACDALNDAEVLVAVLKVRLAVVSE